MPLIQAIPPVRFRRLRIRWEIRDDIHEAFLSLACAIICWRRLRNLALCYELLAPPSAAAGSVARADAIWLSGMTKPAMATITAGIISRGLRGCAIRVIFTEISWDVFPGVPSAGADARLCAPSESAYRTHRYGIQRITALPAGNVTGLRGPERAWLLSGAT
jgi:hypothetical protein